MHKEDGGKNGAAGKDETIEFDLCADISTLLRPSGKRRQSMEGFDEDYTDIVDYIVRCTYKIWDEKNIGLIYTHYQHRSRAHMPHGLVYGREPVVQATAAAINAFPDFKLVVDDVLWRGNDKDGFDTSMPSTAVGTNNGPSMYGPATGRKMCRRGIANCFTRENRIAEEWVVHDDVTTVRQLGFDLDEVVGRLVDSGYCEEEWIDTEGPLERIRGEEEPDALPPAPASAEDVEALIRRAFAETVNWRLLGSVDRYYAPNYRYSGVRNKILYGTGAFKKQLLSWFTLFPDCYATIDDIYWNGSPERGFRSSTRWTLRGTHLGPGIYGKPSGKRVELMLITNHLIRDGRFIEELTLYDDLETCVRIERARRGGS